MGCLVVFIALITAGYSAYVAEFQVSSNAKFRVDKVVRVTNVTSLSSSVANLDYSQSSIVNDVSIPASGSVTYNFDVRNLGNVPVAISDVEFLDSHGTLNNVSYQFTNYTEGTKICDSGNNCTNNITKTIAITVTNNGNSALNTNLNVNFTFAEVYDITFEGSVLGNALAGSNYTYNFPNPRPDSVVITAGTYGSYLYQNGTITINNVESDITLTRGYLINYNGQELGTITNGNTFTYTFTEWPKTVALSGTYSSYTYQNHILTINGIQSTINVTGTYGEIEITNITYSSSTNVLSHQTPTYDGMSANFNVTFKRDANAVTNDFRIVYDVTVTNDYYNDYIFNGFDFDPEITATSDEDVAYIEPSLIGIGQGDTIPAGTTKSFQLVLTLIANNPNGTYGTEIGAEGETTEPEVEEGSITGSISPTTGDLRSPNTRVAFTVNVISTYENAKEYRLFLDSSNFQLVDSNDNSLGSLTINGESTDTYTVYVKVNSTAMFNSSSATTAIYLGASGMANQKLADLVFNVDISAGVDTTPVSVSNATLAMVYEGNNTYPTVGSLKATWSGQDNAGGSGVLNYTVKLYKSDGTFVTSQTVGSTFNEATFTSLDDGNYYVVVYGEDNYHNSGAAYESQADTSPYATKTSGEQFTWRYSVDVSGLTQLSCDNTTAYYKQTYTCNMTPTGSTYNGDYVPDNMNTVYMGGTNLGTNSSATSYYSYSKSSNTRAVLRVYNVTGDITLNATAASSTWCLIEGTKVLMADGKYKNIENINYDDLLLVHSYDTGSLVPEYPIWIEKETSVLTYQKNTFSDGTVLKTVGWHGLFSTNLNRFVSVDNPEEFHVGTKVAKLNKSRTGYDEVTVTNIETVSETINHYHIVSTRYYNIIANDLLTTDGTVILSNLYGFDKNITWPKKVREEALKDVYTYEELKDVLPYYMFMGLRAEEGKFLNNYGIDLNTFKYYLSSNQNNPRLLRQPIMNLGKNMWMVTTSIDNVTTLNKHNYLRYEGSTYTLPRNNNRRFLYWLNTADNKIYYPGDKSVVNHGMYFEAIYK